VCCVTVVNQRCAATAVPFPAGTVVRLRKALSDLASPFGNHDFLWVFVSRLFVQMGICTVQEYLLYYIENAIELPNAMSKEAGVRSSTL
jgi:hypothetical protein